MALAQTSPIEVTEITAKIKGSKEIYFGFEAGDEIIFSFEDLKGKGIKEIQIVKYPEQVKFQDFKTITITEKRLQVNERSIYKFYFKSPAPRTCKIKIQRIPKDENTRNFNTGIVWKEVPDTTFKVYTKNVTIGYENYTVQKSRKVLEKVDTTLQTIIANRTERVHSKAHLTSVNEQIINFQLPSNVYSPNTYDPYETTETVSWAYTIAVGSSGAKWYQDANKKAAASGVVKGAIALGLVSSGYGAIGLLAIEGVSLFSNPPDGDNVHFNLKTVVNGQWYSIGQGNIVATQGNESRYKNGSFSLSLINDNLVKGINVNVNILLVRLTKKYKKEYYTIEQQRPIKEKQVIKEPKKVSIGKIPVHGG